VSVLSADGEKTVTVNQTKAAPLPQGAYSLGTFKFTAGEESAVIFRTAGEKSPVETALSPATRAKFVYEQAAAGKLHLQDRSAIYGMFHLYRFADADDTAGRGRPAP
jgi:hypothetical protein